MPVSLSSGFPGNLSYSFSAAAPAFSSSTDLSTYTSDEIKALTVSQVGGLTTTQVTAISTDAFLD